MIEDNERGIWLLLEPKRTTMEPKNAPAGGGRRVVEIRNIRGLLALYEEAQSRKGNVRVRRIS